MLGQKPFLFAPTLTTTKARIDLVYVELMFVSLKGQGLRLRGTFSDVEVRRKAGSEGTDPIRAMMPRRSPRSGGAPQGRIRPRLGAVPTGPAEYVDQPEGAETTTAGRTGGKSVRTQCHHHHDPTLSGPEAVR